MARSAGNLCAIAQRGVRETKPKPLLPVDAINLIDDAVDIVVELGTALLDLAVKGDEFLGRTAELW